MIHSFGTAAGDGRWPAGALVPLPGGGWLGETEGGGDLGVGTLFVLAGLPPVFTVEPPSQVLPIGTNTVLQAGLIGGPTYYQWYFDGVLVPDASGPTLALTNVVRSQSGAYSLLATNAFGSAISSNAVLTIVAPLRLATVPVPAAGPFQLEAGYADDWPVTTDDLPHFTAEWSTNLVQLDGARQFARRRQRLADPDRPGRDEFRGTVLPHLPGALSLGGTLPAGD